MQSRQRCQCWWVVASVLCVGSVALAEPAGEPSAEDKELAKQYFFDGKQAQDDGDYSKAVSDYEKAYELIPEPLLLFNLGQAHRLAGNKREAVEYYEKYLRAEPDGRGAEIADKFKQQLLVELRAEEAEAKEKEKEAARRKQLEEERRDRKIRSQNGDGPDGGSRPGAVLRWSGIGLAAVGAVSLGVGIKYGLDAKEISDQLSEPRDAWTPELLAKEDEGASAETKMYVLTAIGSGAIIGGGLMYYFGWRAQESSSDTQALWFTPTATADGVGAVLGGRF